MNIYNLIVDAFSIPTTMSPEDAQIIDEVVDKAVNAITSTSTVMLILYTTLSLLLWYLGKSKYPYIRIMSHGLFSLLQAGVLVWLILLDNNVVSIVAQSTLLLCAVVCLLERIIMAIRVHSIAPFTTTADLFAIVKTTCDSYVFPVDSAVDNLVVLTTSRGLYCNGMHIPGSITISDTVTIVSLCKRYVLLLDRVEHGYDYTVFIFINNVILENIHPKTGVINNQFDAVEL
ncbi:NS3 protein [Cynopterus bat coronavirus]|nr:NS3 protein [Cynopterus bat coronavirus]